MRDIKKIVVHHSATTVKLSLEKSVNSFNNSHKARLHPRANGYGMHIAYHHVIAWDGRSRKTRPYSEIGYHASNWEVNKTSIWICLCWSFDIEQPTEAQYIELARIINDIKTAYPNATIHGHNEFAKKTCPGKNFNFEYLNTKLEPAKEVKKDWPNMEVLKKEFPNRKPIFNDYGKDGEIKALIEIAMLRASK